MKDVQDKTFKEFTVFKGRKYVQCCDSNVVFVLMKYLQYTAEWSTFHMSMYIITGERKLSVRSNQLLSTATRPVVF